MNQFNSRIFVPGKLKFFCRGFTWRCRGSPDRNFVGGSAVLALRSLSPWQARADGLRVELRGDLVGAFTDIEKRLSCFLDHDSGLLVKRMGKFADVSQFLEQFVGLSIRKTRQKIVDARNRIVETRERIVGFGDRLVDDVAPARQRGRIGLETQ